VFECSRLKRNPLKDDVFLQSTACTAAATAADDDGDDDDDGGGDRRYGTCNSI